MDLANLEGVFCQHSFFRFEDQRGTEICFEIPEFLRKPKEESEKSNTGNILKKI